jgi:hypothetical protein
MTTYEVCLDVLGGDRQCFQVEVKRGGENPEVLAVRNAKLAARLRGYITDDTSVVYVQERNI